MKFEEKLMKLKNLFAALLLAFFSLGVAHAAGAPMNEDLAKILALSQKAAASGKEGNAAAFVQDAEAALQQSKTQIEQRSSPSLERIVPKLKTAVREGKAGNLTAGVEAVEAAISLMGKKDAPKFGGGS
jgi:hypothetical protein